MIKTEKQFKDTLDELDKIYKANDKLKEAAPDSLDNHIYNVKALQGYSRWVPTTPTESELINAIKYSVKRSKDAIKKATE